MKTKLIKIKKEQKIKVTENTQYILDLSDISSNTSLGTTALVELVFEKKGIESELIGLYKLRKGQKLNLTTIANHNAPNTTCHTKIKGVLLDNTLSDYTGKILITKKAQKTTSYLQDDVLVVGDKTKNNSQPILEIEADDVKASHGSTTGRVGNEQVYYLMSRGLSKKEAEDLVLDGFFEELLSEISDTKVREKVANSLKS